MYIFIFQSTNVYTRCRHLTIETPSASVSFEVSTRRMLKAKIVEASHSRRGTGERGEECCTIISGENFVGPICLITILSISLNKTAKSKLSLNCETICYIATVAGLFVSWRENEFHRWHFFPTKSVQNSVRAASRYMLVCLSIMTILPLFLWFLPLFC